MFCPKCGKADQSPETFCRQCGIFLPDIEKSAKKRQTPEDHLKANTFLSLFSIIVSFTLAIALYSIFLPRNDTHWVIYLTAGFLIAIGAWQIQSLWRTLLLKKHFNKNRTQSESALETEAMVGKVLDKADLGDIIMPSITERTTRNLIETKNPSSKSQH